MSPTSAKGSDSITMSVFPTLPKVKHRSRKMIASVVRRNKSHAILRALHVLKLSAPDK